MRILAVLCLILATLPLRAQEVISARRRAASAPVSFSDSFPTTGHLSSNWTDFSTPTNPCFQVHAAAQLEADGNTGGGLFQACTAAWTANTFTANQYGCVGPASFGSHTATQAGVRETASQGYDLNYDASSTVWQILLNGGSSIATTTAQAYGNHEYCLIANGSSLTALDTTSGTTLMSVTDSTYASGGGPGLYTYSDVGATNSIGHWRGASGALTSLTVGTLPATTADGGSQTLGLVAGTFAYAGHVTSFSVQESTAWAGSIDIGVCSISGGNATVVSYVTVTLASTTAVQTFTAPANFTSFAVSAGQYPCYYSAGGNGTGKSSGGDHSLGLYFSSTQTSIPTGAVPVTFTNTVDFDLTETISVP